MPSRDAARRDRRAQARARGARRRGTAGEPPRPDVVGAWTIRSRAALVDEIKRQLQSEMGLLPVRLLRERRESFVELTRVRRTGKTSYGTAGYLGNGYFVTVKHGVVALGGRRRGARRSRRSRSSTTARDLAARLVDAGDADVEVHSGDWAIIQVAERRSAGARVDTSFAYDFADPIFRLGNDYSKGIILSTGYVGQRTSNGLVTCLTDGHPGVSGGGVLDQDGDLVGIPIGRMQGDYRFSFILPVRAEMFRKVPALETRSTVAGSCSSSPRLRRRPMAAVPRLKPCFLSSLLASPFPRRRAAA